MHSMVTGLASIAEGLVGKVPLAVYNLEGDILKACTAEGLTLDRCMSKYVKHLRKNMMSCSFLGFHNKVLDLTGCEWCHQSFTRGFKCHQRSTIASTKLKRQENHTYICV